MQSTHASRGRISRHFLCVIGIAFALVFTFIAIATSYWAVVAEPIENGTRVEEESELTYYLTVKYDGVDKYGVESTDTTTANIRSGITEVVDHIPDGLDFIGFKTTDTGHIGAIERSDSTVSCPGHVIDDTGNESVETGSWNAAHTEYTYHGLHYYSASRTVKFKTTDVQAGCNLTVGIITKTPALGDVERMDFYNTGRVSEGLISKDSNMVHVWMGKDTALIYNVTYSYTGDVPENAPALPSSQSYTQNSTVNVAMEPSLDGYEFSGWTTSDATVSGGVFSMPGNNVNFVGVFVEKQTTTKYTVTYEVNSDAPAGYIVPKEKTYEAGEVVSVDSTQENAVIDDYIFSGWTSNDVSITDGSFIMPEGNVTITGSFTRQTYTVTYAFEGSVLPPNAPSLLPAPASYPVGAVVTLAANPSAEGYRFTGWYSEPSFVMPAKNLVIYGEWSIQEGVFSPTITISIPNQQDSYHVNQVVDFDIIVTNTADFSITDVRVLDQLDGTVFLTGAGYTLTENRLVSIPTLAANESITLKAQYTVTNDETAEIINTVAIVGATASEANYNIDTTKDYTDSVSFNTKSWQDIPVLTGVLMGNVGPYITIIAMAICCIGIYVIFRKADDKKERSLCPRSLSRTPRRALRVSAIIVASSFSILLISRVFAVPTEPIPSIELTSQHTSFASGEPGAWKVNKMAGWTSSSTARIIVDVESLLKSQDEDNDVILVVDNGKSMDSDRLPILKDSLTSFTNAFLDEGDNNLALVTFSHGYYIETGFTNDRDLLLSKISDISADSSKTNYYQGLNGAERLLDSYTESEGRNTIIVFLTDGAPNEELLYQIAEYWLIKNKYPFVTVNAIQYEMGDSVNNNLASISDYQFVADGDNLTDVIIDASIAPYGYDEFVLTDHINDEFFTISGSDAIRVNRGTASLDYDGTTPKITWDMSEKLRSGARARMEIDINLKPEYITTPALFPTNRSASVKSSLYNTASENVTTESTPILKTDFIVTYAANAPSDCEVSGIPEPEAHFVYTAVEITDIVPTCSGYNFAGYDIVEDQVTRLNDDYFRMPSKSVTLGATWTKVDLNKSMEGSIYTAKTLYKEMAKRSLMQGSDGNYNIDSDINFGQASSATNGDGANTVASTANDEYPVHYFRGAVADNNVLFADICWKAMRTTNTGGVKLVYNGKADNSNQCGASRSAHDGFGGRSSQNLSNNYYYGTDYTYNESAKTFTLSGIKYLARWDATTSDSLVGKYTCKSANENASCSTLYYIESKQNDNSAYALPLNSSTAYWAIGKMQFNAEKDSMAYVGYMYGDVYPRDEMTISSTYGFITEAAVLQSTSLSTDFYYANGMTYGTDVADKYSLTNPYQVSSASDYASLLGKYTFRASQSDYHNNVIYYIAGVDGSAMYYLEMQDGQTLSDVDTSYMIGDSVINNGNGTYTLNNPFTMKRSEWGSRYSEAKGMFTCGNNTNTTCSNPQYIQDSFAFYYNYIPVSSTLTIAKSHSDLGLTDTTTVKLYQLSQNPSNYSEYKYTCGDTSTTCTSSNLRMVTEYTATSYSYTHNIIFGASVTWNGTSYTLNNTKGLESYNNMTDISTHHYVCPTFGQTSCTQVRYIYYYTGTSNAFYITLSNGVDSIDAVLAAMKENRTNSLVKSAIDAWYAHTLVGYTDKIEDVQYCNNRNFWPYNVGGWNANGGKTNGGAYFAAIGNSNHPSFDCPSNDAFTVSAANGNGKLIYPVGLLTEDELTLAGHGINGYSDNTYLYNGNSSSWSMTPYSFHQNNALNLVWNTRTGYADVNISYGSVRPVISIIPGTIISDGDGSENSPWVLE